MSKITPKHSLNRSKSIQCVILHFSMHFSSDFNHFRITPKHVISPIYLEKPLPEESHSLVLYLLVLVHLVKSMVHLVELVKVAEAYY